MSILSHLPEEFLHYVWRTLNFEVRNLRTTDGQLVQIIKPGIWNHDQGPDFLQAHLRIGEIAWHGQVEIHCSTGDWYRHGHDKDPQYNATILHIVYESTHQPVRREDGTVIPELALKNLIPSHLMARYQQLQLATAPIPCAAVIQEVPTFHLRSWITRMTIERVEQKATKMQKRLEQHTQNWEQVLWEELAAMMGGPVNQAACREMAQRIPVGIVKKYAHQPSRLEALLFGVCGLLTVKRPEDPYYTHLQTEWAFLKRKHQISHTNPIAIRFLRMRPASFPTIRISQLAHFVHHFPNLIRLLEPGMFDQVHSATIAASTYWNTHFRFFEPTPSKVKKLGKTQKTVLIINTLVPLAWIYHQAHGREDLDSLIENSLSDLAPENNRITRVFMELGISNESAMDSQGLIQLKKYYCDAKKCLSCGIGARIMKGKRTKKLSS